jgi:hypothetical protein
MKRNAAHKVDELFGNLTSLPLDELIERVDGNTFFPNPAMLVTSSINLPRVVHTCSLIAGSQM